MAPPYLSVFYLVVPPFAVPVVLRIGIRSICTPIPLLALLSLVSGGLGLIEESLVQAVLQTLIAAALGGSVLHLQGLACAPVPMLATTALLLICATFLSILPRLSQVSPILFLIFIVASLSTTVLLFLASRRTRFLPVMLTPIPPSPTPSHVSFQFTNFEVKQSQFSSEPALSQRHHSPQQRAILAPSSKTNLFLILSVQLSFIISTSFGIPTAIGSPAASSTLVSLFAISSDHVPIATYIFHIFDIAFTVIALLLVFVAYYNCSDHLALRDIRAGSTSTSNGTPHVPCRPMTRIRSSPPSPTPMRLDPLIPPSSPPNTFISPIKLNLFKPRHKRDGISASSSFFSPYPKRSPFKRISLAPTSDLEHEFEIGKLSPYIPKQISPSPSSSVTCIATNPIVPAPDVKEHSSIINNAVPFPSPACNPALVRVATPMPVLCRERAWSWAHSAHVPKNKRDATDVTFDDEDCTDLKDPFASGLVRPTVAPSAYRRWAESVEGSLAEVRRWSQHEVYPQTRMSTWGHLPSDPPRQGGMEPSKRINTTVCAST